MVALPARCTSCVSNWNEEITREFDNGARLARASVTQTYNGDIAGESVVEYIMSYGVDGRVKFIGLEVLAGSVGGRFGSVVMQHDGAFVGNHARSDWSFVPGSGTGELVSLRGSGTFESVDNQNVNSSFVYTFGES
jgi:hypothetical protein